MSGEGSSRVLLWYPDWHRGGTWGSPGLLGSCWRELDLLSAQMLTCLEAGLPSPVVQQLTSCVVAPALPYRLWLSREEGSASHC